VIQVKFVVNRISCNEQAKMMVSTDQAWVQIACLLCALLQMIMTFRYFFKTKSFFEKLNQDYARKIEAVFGSRV
jgi:hypothetical protein